MFAVNHAATALVLKRRYEEVPLGLLLVSVQLVELLWVVLNYVGVEATHTDEVVRFVGDIHLAHMPWSHSVATTLVLAALAGLAAAAWRGRRVGVAVGLGVASHLALDVLTHAPDIPLVPGGAARLGLGLYTEAPLAAFALELGWGLLAWRIYRGGRALLATIVGFNLANLTLFVPALAGVEGALAHRPLAIVTLVAVQIVVTLLLVGWFGRRASSARERPAAVIAA